MMPVCRGCGAEHDRQFVRAEYVYGGKPEHNFWECKDCGLVYLYPLPSKDEEDYFYAKEFEKFMEFRAAGDRDWSGAEAHIKTNQDNVKRRWRFLEKHLKKGRSILEIGCSSGFMLDAFGEAGLHPTGIEPSGAFYEYLTNKGHTVFRSIEGLQATQKGRFDLIVHFFVLEHIRDTRAFIETQLSLLKPGGLIIAEVPCVNDPLTSVYTIPAFERFYWSIAHHYYFNPRSLSCILDRIGCAYAFEPEQRYDISNHITWLQAGKPGGQGKFNHIFSERTRTSYTNDLTSHWLCDTFFVYICRAGQEIVTV